MRRALILPLPLLMILCSFGQDLHYIDSLRNILNRGGSDTARTDALYQISHEFINVNADSCIHYARQGLSLAKKINYKKGQNFCMDYLAVGLVIKGNYTNSLPLFFEALQEAEKYGYADRMGSLLNNIGDTYAELGDYNRAIVYAKRNLILSQREHDLELEVLACLNLGEYFINLGQVDSALIYENKAYERNRVFKSSSMDQDILYNLGRIQAKFNNGDIALPYYRRSVLLLPQTSDLVYASKAMYGIGELFEEKAHVDSALYFYKHAAS